MTLHTAHHELHHEIFGSILDRTELRPYLLLGVKDYATALKQATKMMGNRGFDITLNGDLPDSEKMRAQQYCQQAFKYFLNGMRPFVEQQLTQLLALESLNAAYYQHFLQALHNITAVLIDPEFVQLVEVDPRHVFLMAAAQKYPDVFSGYQNIALQIPLTWQQTACALLKLTHLIKSIEEDSQDINDFAQLGFFLQTQQQNLDDLYRYDWDNPQHIPKSEPAQQAFVKIATFFHKLKASLFVDAAHGGLVFDSGDGVQVNILEIKARLKSPESMFTKLGKDLEGEAFDIHDILAITFILREKDDTLKLFHALQKRGVILQENTASQSITQTLFDDPDSMLEAVQRLMLSLASSSGDTVQPTPEALQTNADDFYNALTLNAAKNQHSSKGHRKFQCKITFSLPIHRAADTHKIIIPGTLDYVNRHTIKKTTQQHTLGVELRISDQQSWQESERTADAHHDAYKFRQLLVVMNRIFKNEFSFPSVCVAQLRIDQAVLFQST
ncbi:MAG: hypothetical protein HOP02_05600 [Methylococcaceae bacterium]|nr:hypothetical protein [Methylococcaceae bacterium]